MLWIPIPLWVVTNIDIPDSSIKAILLRRGLCSQILMLKIDSWSIDTVVLFDKCQSVCACITYSMNAILEFWSTAAIQLTDVTSKNCFDRERLMWIRFARHIPFRRAHINSKALYKLDLAREAAPGWKKDWPRVQSCSHRVMQRYGKR